MSAIQLFCEYWGALDAQIAEAMKGRTNWADGSHSRNSSSRNTRSANGSAARAMARVGVQAFEKADQQ